MIHGKTTRDIRQVAPPNPERTVGYHNQSTAGIRPRQDGIRTCIGVINAHGGSRSRPRHRFSRAGRVMGYPSARSKADSKASSSRRSSLFQTNDKPPRHTNPTYVSELWDGFGRTCAGVKPRLANYRQWCELHTPRTPLVLLSVLRNVVKYHG